MLNGKYQQFELDHIGKIRPEFKLRKAPTLDQVIVSFLAKYDVFVKPVSSKMKTGEAIRDGAITGAFGSDLGGDAFIISGQNKQTQVQEWTRWKQWALDHKDFEAYRVEKIDKAKEKYFATLKKLEDPKIQEELQPIVDEFNKKNKKEATLILGFLLISIVVVVVLVVYANSLAS